MLLFPEATTGDGLALRKFHSSHFAAARDLLATASEVETVFVQPVAIRYSTPAAAWFGDATLLPHLWSILKGEPIRCDLAFGKPLAYGRGENRKVHRQADRIRHRLASGRTGPRRAGETPTLVLFAPVAGLPEAAVGDLSRSKSPARHKVVDSQGAGTKLAGP